MEIREEIIQQLVSPWSWVLAEIISIVLLLAVIYDINKKHGEKERIMRLFEVFGFIAYAVIFENLGVISGTYDYSLKRWFLAGVVPIAIPIIEAVIFYSAVQFAEKLEFPKWTYPFITGFYGMMIDFTIDPVAVADKHWVNGVLQGRWVWKPYYDGMFFGIPYFNFTGWFALMSYYTVLILIGRHYYEKHGQKTSIGIAYIILSILIGDILIASPVTEFLLFLSPIFPMFGHKIPEIIMLVIVSISIITVLGINWKRPGKIVFREHPLPLLVPVTIYAYNIFIAMIYWLKIAFIPVFLFSMAHVVYILYYTKIKE